MRMSNPAGSPVCRDPPKTRMPMERPAHWLFGDQLGPHFLTPGPQGPDRDAPSRHDRGPGRLPPPPLPPGQGPPRAVRDAPPGGRAGRPGRVRAGRHVPGGAARTAVGGRAGDGAAIPTSRAALGLVRSLDGSTCCPPAASSSRRDDFGAWADERGRRTAAAGGLLPVGAARARPAHGRRPTRRAAAGTSTTTTANRRRREARTLGRPAPYRPREDAIDDEVRRDLDRWERDGEVRSSAATGRAASPRPAARRWPRSAASCAHRLAGFGRTEDAMLAADPVMSHSLLSSSLNLGLLDPAECVERGGARLAVRATAPFNSVEGFVRQIAGWREYVWQLYWHFGEEYRHRNALRHRAPLPGLVPRPRRRRRHGPLPGDGPGPGPRHRLDPPHPAADGARQPRPPAGLGPGGGHRLVPPLLRRRLRLGDAAERRRDVPVRRRRTDDHQAVHLRRRLHAPDERPLRSLRLPSRPDRTGERRLPVHRRATGPSCTGTAAAWRTTTAWPGGARPRPARPTSTTLLRQQDRRTGPP